MRDGALWWPHWVMSLAVAVVAVIAIGCLCASTIFGGRLPDVDKATSNPDEGQRDPGVNTGALSSATALTMGIAQRNAAWSSYVLSAVGILLTVVVLVATLWNEMRYSVLHSEWKELCGRVKSEATEISKDFKRDINQICVPMASFMVRTAIHDTMYPTDRQSGQVEDDYLMRTAHEGVKLLVRYEEKHSAKETAVRRLSRFADKSTLVCLNEIEKSVAPQLEACDERDDLFEVIRTTRMVVMDALDAARRGDSGET